MLLVAFVASLAGLFGCDDDKDDTMLLLALVPPAWTVTTPENGAENVSFMTTIVLEHNGDLDETFDDEEVTLKYNDTVLTLDNDNCMMSIDGNKVTIVRIGFYNYGTKYSLKKISGFKDVDGDDIRDYNVLGYSFTTESEE